MKLVVVIASLLLAHAAYADPEADADRAFRDAQAQAVAGDPRAAERAMDALEALGSRRPITRWSDDAWLEAARVAERSADYTRAGRDLEQAIAISTDDQFVRRARAELARISGFAGAAGQWSEIAAQHERIEERVLAGGDPKPALAELETLVRDHPQYPRAAVAMLVIAQGWERDGDSARAIEWLQRAKTAAPDPLIRLRASAELARALIRRGKLTAAHDEIATLGDPALRRDLEASLARAEWQQGVRWIMWAVLAAVGALAIIVLRRGSASWRVLGRRLVHPPIEALFFIPTAAVIVVIAQTGNPLVARAVRWIAISGALVAWLSGVILEAARTRHGSIGLRRAAAHAVIAAIAVACCAYLAIDHDRMIDLVITTWREGPEK